MIIATPPPDPTPPSSEPRVLLAEWAAENLVIDNNTVQPPEPCLICGAASNTCTTHVTETTTMPREALVQGTEAANADPNSNLFVCPEDVVEEFQAGIPGRTERPSHRLLHHKGEVISRERAVELGLVAPAGSDSPPAPDPGPLSTGTRSTAEGQAFTVPQQ